MIRSRRPSGSAGGKIFTSLSELQGYTPEADSTIFAQVSGDTTEANNGLWQYINGSWTQTIGGYVMPENFDINLIEQP